MHQRKWTRRVSLLEQLLGGLIRDLGIDRAVNKPMDGSELAIDDLDSPSRSIPRRRGDSLEMDSRTGGSLKMQGTVTLPSQSRPENQYTGTLSHSRYAQLMRMDNLFEEIESKVLRMLEPGCDILQMISLPNDENLDAKSRLASKPVVIGDAVPVPVICPEPVEQLLQAALAHHNLGSFEEALKFLEAARMQMEDIAAVGEGSGKGKGKGKGEAEGDSDLNEEGEREDEQEKIEEAKDPTLSEEEEAVVNRDNIPP